MIAPVLSKIVDGLYRFTRVVGEFYILHRQRNALVRLFGKVADYARSLVCHVACRVGDFQCAGI